MPSYTLLYGTSRYVLFGENQESTVHGFLRDLLDTGIDEFYPEVRIRNADSDEWRVVEVKDALFDLGFQAKRCRPDGSPLWNNFPRPHFTVGLLSVP